jgi:branched-chain amino acid transport system substrate-binding protein
MSDANGRSSISRRGLLAGAAATSIMRSRSGLAQNTEPLRIGFLTVKTGPLAAGGKQQEEGVAFFLKERNGTIAGRKVELVIADTGGNPAGAKTKTQELVERDRVHVIIGPLAAFEALAIDDYIKQVGVPVVSPSAAAEDMTQRKPNPWFVRAVGTSAQANHALGDYAAKTLKYRRVAAIAMDNNFGHEGIGGFQRVFEDLGGKVVQKTWVPLNAMDFAPYLTQVPRDVDAVVQVFVAGQAVRFAKQYGESALQGKVPLIGTGVFTDQSSLQGMGDEVIGHVGALVWAPTLDNPTNRAFVALAESKVKRTPSYFHAVMYSSGRWIIEAAKALGGNVEDRDRLLAALRKASETTPDPRGPIKLDEYGNPTENVYIVKVEKVNGRLQNTVIHTYPMVSQFWTYKPDEFLKSPPYDRNYPPVKP